MFAQVEVLGPGKQAARVLYEGSYFGEGGILGDVRRMESIRARTACSLCVLEVSHKPRSTHRAVTFEVEATLRVGLPTFGVETHPEKDFPI